MDTPDPETTPQPRVGVPERSPGRDPAPLNAGEEPAGMAAPRPGRSGVSKAAILGVVALLAVGSTVATEPLAANAPAPPPASRPCALRAAPRMSMSEGFPDRRAREFARSTGPVRALTLLIDFPDAPAPYGARERYAEFFPAVSDWYDRSSYGRLTYLSTPVLRYIRMPRPFASYGIGRGYGWDTHTKMMHDLLQVADGKIEFKGYDLINILVTPNAGPPADEAVLSVTWTGASAATAHDGARLDRVSLVYGHDQSGARVLSHENGHAFGLPDLYDADDFQHTDALSGQWDSMSLDWGLQGDLFAWHKWRLGWIDDSQIACLTGHGSWTYSLRAVALPGGRKAVVVPLGRTSAYVIEAREAAGNDHDACREGVLVYTVRTNVESGEGPVVVHDAHPGTTACDFSSGSFNSLNDAPFGVGEHFTDPSAHLAMNVLGRTGTGEWTIRVTRW